MLLNTKKGRYIDDKPALVWETSHRIQYKSYHPSDDIILRAQGKKVETYQQRWQREWKESFTKIQKPEEYRFRELKSLPMLSTEKIYIPITMTKRVVMKRMDSKPMYQAPPEPKKKPKKPKILPPIKIEKPVTPRSPDTIIGKRTVHVREDNVYFQSELRHEAHLSRADTLTPSGEFWKRLEPVLQIPEQSTVHSLLPIKSIRY